MRRARAILLDHHSRRRDGSGSRTASRHGHAQFCRRAGRRRPQEPDVQDHVRADERVTVRLLIAAIHGPGAGGHTKIPRAVTHRGRVAHPGRARLFKQLSGQTQRPRRARRNVDAHARVDALIRRKDVGKAGVGDADLRARDRREQHQERAECRPEERLQSLHFLTP